MSWHLVERSERGVGPSEIVSKYPKIMKTPFLLIWVYYYFTDMLYNDWSSLFSNNERGGAMISWFFQKILYIISTYFLVIIERIFFFLAKPFLKQIWFWYLIIPYCEIADYFVGNFALNFALAAPSPIFFDWKNSGMVRFYTYENKFCWGSATCW